MVASSLIAALGLLSSAAYASPVVIKRQDASSASVMPPAMGPGPASVVPPSGSASAPPTPPTMSGSMSAPVPPPSMSSMSMPAAPSASSYPAYPCPSGYSLTYVNVNRTFDASLSTLAPYSNNFDNATWMYVSSGSGGNTPGATRTVSPPNQPARMEVLVSYTTDLSNIALQTVTNLTSGPIMAGQTMISNYSTVLQVIPVTSGNSTSGSSNSTSTTLKLFCNVCAQDKAAGIQAVMASFMQDFDNVQTILSGGQIQGLNSSSTASMPMPTAGASSVSAMSMPSAPAPPVNGSMTAPAGPADMSMSAPAPPAPTTSA